MRIIYTSVFLICTLFTSSVFAVEKSDLIGDWHCNENPTKPVFSNLDLRLSIILKEKTAAQIMRFHFYNEKLQGNLMLLSDWEITDNIISFTNSTDHYISSTTDKMLSRKYRKSLPNDKKLEFYNNLQDLMGIKNGSSDNKMKISLSNEKLTVQGIFECYKFK